MFGVLDDQNGEQLFTVFFGYLSPVSAKYYTKIPTLSYVSFIYCEMEELKVIYSDIPSG